MLQRKVPCTVFGETLLSVAGIVQPWYRGALFVRAVRPQEKLNGIQGHGTRAVVEAAGLSARRRRGTNGRLACALGGAWFERIPLALPTPNPIKGL